jgi:hypothetical protein
LTLRPFIDFCYDPVPRHDAFNRGFNWPPPGDAHAGRHYLGKCPD